MFKLIYLSLCLLIFSASVLQATETEQSEEKTIKEINQLPATAAGGNDDC